MKRGAYLLLIAAVLMGVPACSLAGNIRQPGVGAPPDGANCRDEVSAALTQPAATECVPDAPYVLEEALFEGTVDDKLGLITVQYRVQAIRSRPVLVPLFDQQQAIIQATLPRDVFIVQRQGWYQALLPGEGNYRFSLQLSVPVVQRADRNVLSLAVNPAALSRMELKLDGADLDVQATAPMQVQVRAGGKLTRVCAYPGSSKVAEISWVAKPAGLSNAALQYHAETGTLMSVVPGLIRNTLQLTYTVVQGRMNKMQVALPEAANVITVKADYVKFWEVKKESGRQVLEIETLRDIAETYVVTVELEEAAELPEDGGYSVPMVQCIGAERQSGYVAIAVKDDVNIRELQREGGTQIDPAELPESLRTQAGGAQNISFAYRFVRSPALLRLHMEKIQPEISAHSILSVDIGRDTLQLFARIDYTIHRAGVFGFQCVLPPDMEVTDVSGPQIETWKLTPGPEAALLEVHLRSKAIGTYRLSIKMEKPTEDLYRDLTLPVLTVNNVDKITGYIGISADSSIRIKTKQRSRLTEVGLEELPEKLPGAATLLAYKFISQPYALSLAVEKVDTRVTADVFTFVSLAEGLLLSNSAISYDILFAGTDVFSFSLPSDLSGVDITGEGIKHKDERTEQITENGATVERTVYTVTLHTPVKGPYTLYCSYEKNLTAGTKQVEIPALEIFGVDRQTGAVAIGSDSNLQIELAQMSGLNQVDIKELPADKISGLTIPLIYGLKYVRAPYRLAVDITKHEDVSVLVAVVEQAAITSVFSQDGQLIVHARYRIKNRAKQYMDVQLPKDAAIWSTFVDELPVKPSQSENGRILLPLAKQEEKERSYWVDLIYETACPKMGVWGAISLNAPQLDIPQTNVSWEVYLPEKFRYVHFGGNVEPGNLTRLPEPVRSGTLSGRGVENECRFRDESVPAVPNAPSPGMRPEEQWQREDDRMRESVCDFREKKIERYGAAVSAESGSMYDQAAQVPAKRTAATKDQNFASNLASQIMRLEQRRSAAEPQTVTQGRQKGVLPIQITIPVGGRQYRFVKLFTREPLQITMNYYRVGKIGWIIKLLLVLAAVYGISLFRRMRNRTE